MTPTNGDRSFFRVVWAVVFVSFCYIAYRLLTDPDNVTSGAAVTLWNRYVNQPLGIPWQAYGIAYAAFAVLLCHWRTRFLGYFLPACLSIIWVGSSLFYTVLPGRGQNIFTSGEIAMITLLLFVGARWSRQAAHRNKAGR